MKVLDVATKNTLESENEFVIEQWKKLPDRYKPQTAKLPNAEKNLNENNNKLQNKDKQDEHPAKDVS